VGNNHPKNELLLQLLALLAEPDNWIQNTYKIYPELPGVVATAAVSAMAAVKALRPWEISLFLKNSHVSTHESG
jgi:hypothetical protein